MTETTEQAEMRRASLQGWSLSQLGGSGAFERVTFDTIANYHGAYHEVTVTADVPVVEGGADKVRLLEARESPRRRGEVAFDALVFIPDPGCDRLRKLAVRAAETVTLDCGHCGGVAVEARACDLSDGAAKCRACGFPGELVRVAITEIGHVFHASSRDSACCKRDDCAKCAPARERRTKRAAQLAAEAAAAAD